MISKLNLRVPLSKILLFLIPTQLAYHFWPQFSFVFGFRIDYLAPTVYFTDLLTVVLVADFLLSHPRLFLTSIKKNKIQITLILLVVLANIIFALNPILASIRWIKILEFAFLAYCLSNNKKLKTSEIQNTLFLSAVFFSILGTIQFLLGETVGLEILGERTFSVSTPGIALVSIYGSDYLRAYSTFGHPNAAAGYYGVLLVWSLFTDNFLRPVSKRIGFFVLLLGFLMTFSRGAFLSVAVSMLVLFLLKGRARSWIVYLTALASILFVNISEKISWIHIFSAKEIEERLSLAKVSLEMSGSNFLTGVGVNNFIPAIPFFNETAKNIWLLQPVHNIFLLILSEGGILLTVITLFLFSKFVSGKGVLGVLFLFVIFTGFFDHYWVTLQQNLLLVSVLVACFYKKYHVVG